MKKADPHHHSESQPINLKAHFNRIKGNSLANQRMRLITALRAGTVDTNQARNDLDIMHPAGRVKELRELGYNIHMNWITVVSENGQKHRIGRYVLLAGTWQGGAA